MTLTAGTKLGPYEVVAPAGAGGMGEVYRAHDSRLNREVAIKVLPAAFARDADRLRRFQQEARAVAALNHPNILAIHDFGQHDGSPYIAMEFLEGETLRTRLDGGALPVRKAIELSEQIARGLAAAHDKGIVHRDLKPENIFVIRDGRVKILDFGLAKLTQELTTPDAATLPSRTEPGVVMGTVGYMSPEQVKGLAADHRSDLFSFGAILYEMLSGKRAFRRSTSAETMTAILKEDPPAACSGPSISPMLQHVVNHCLEKDPEQRFQSASDLSFALRALHDSSGSPIAAMKGTDHRSRLWWAGGAAGVLLAGSFLAVLITHIEQQYPKARISASILPPPGDGFWANINQPAAVSPDGKVLALIAMRNGRTLLWLRHLDSADAQPIAGSEDASYPFWSPDGRYVAFFAASKIKKLDVRGGTVTDVCASGYFNVGGAWSSRGVIIFATLGDALKQVPENGGAPGPIPGIDVPSDAIGHMWPVFLPDGKHFLFLEWRYPGPGSHANGVWMGSLDGDKARRLPLDSTNVQYASGYLLFSRDGDLLAQRFDPKRGELSGSALPVVRGIQYDRFAQDGAFSVSEDGVLVYATAGTGINDELTWMDRSGKMISTLGDPQQYIDPAISPDGKRVAVATKPSNGREQIWVYDVERGTRFPLDSDESHAVPHAPTWSPDGRQLAYRDMLGRDSRLHLHASDGSGVQKNLGETYRDLIDVADWSSDGRYLVLERTKFVGPDNWHNSIEVVRIDEPAKPVLEVDSASTAKFSPDGHWLAYSDDTSGQVYITSFPGQGGRSAVTSDGGGEPRWRGDGQELFYVADDLMITSILLHESANDFRVLSSHPLFRMQFYANERNYDVTRDGQRFLMTYRAHKEQAAPLTLVTNWPATLRTEMK